ncbi:glycogen debranching enzyme [Aspergillus pseudotamarii]|uniref:Glycogen debranching enzyme n=1 Tax=Aspergillus pseudotamarii TaxID=132259 RepID=A0A5N6T372_ASPPS|nr:glycogen debranching enzyme [Aspergillus pseudotamarii]KAE8140755.1 glycogen debranching enzyme [Aspergillus pseudotamarii]
MPVPRQVYLLPLRDDGSPDVPGGYIYLPPPTSPPYSLRFVVEGSSSICREGRLWVNIPEDGKPFNRSVFRSFRLHPDFNKNIQIDIPITSPGSFAFYTAYSPLPDFSVAPVETSEPVNSPIHYIDVAPRLTLGGRVLPLNALSIFSVISKFMGRYPTDWEEHLNGIGQRNYNMVHFTPLMKRGTSNSPYSIFDQLEFDEALFPNGEDDVNQMVKNMEENHGLLSLTDVVWNHTANNSKWLEEHPEAGYSVETAPWLEAALELDTALLQFGEDLQTLGLPTEFKTADDLIVVMNVLRERVIGDLRLWEYYVVNVKADTRRIVDNWAKSPEIDLESDQWSRFALKGFKNLSFKEQASFIREHAIPTSKMILGRFSRAVDDHLGAAILTALLGPGGSNHDEAENRFTQLLDEVNLPFYTEYDADVSEIMEQVFNRIKYLRIDDHGPKLGPVTKESPLIETYFTRLPVNEITKQQKSTALALVNNGWIWNADALRDNAGPDSKAYLRREVIVWGDCVKLRYGNCPEDSPFLWEFMTKYTRLMAKYFSGFRIDNCHSTPLGVAEYLLDEARKVRPNLTVFAELFTGSEEADYVFVKRLGINALIREAMQAWSSGELSRLVHRHGGRPIGSFDLDLPTAGSSHAIASAGTDNQEEAISQIRPCPVQALFMDCTHDNEMPAQKRTAVDTLPNAALVSMCASAIGSVMGYDEVYPKLVDLVHETRLYSSAFSGPLKGELGSDGGIGSIKKTLNQLHTMMGADGYDETHIHHDGEYITVHRVHPKTRKGIFLIAHTSFPDRDGHPILAPTHLTGTRVKPLGAWRLEVESGENARAEVLADKHHLRGLPSVVRETNAVKVEERGDDTIISVLESFVAGSIALFETSIPTAEHSTGLDRYITEGADQAFSKLSLVDLNFVLYRCEAEERDSSDGQDGVYDIPNYGPLVYAGLQGWWSVLENIIRYNELGHPLCDHLRQGQWALDYIIARLEKVAQKDGYNALNDPASWLRDKFNAVRELPSFLLPRYFAIILQVAYNAAWKQGIRLLGGSIQKGQEFVHQLGMVSVQQTGYVKSASLWPTKRVSSLAAGLPHFAVDWARCWGRDVFISLRGLLLCTGRFDDAKEHILAFASVLKHGMIPNLLSSGKLPRYNSRDSVWFFLQAIQDYTTMVPNGIELLGEKVSRRFLPYDDTWFPFDDPRAYSQHSTITEVIQEVLQRHAQGLSFREYNAGPELDMQMKPEGFQIDVNVDWETGLLFGGSQFNCGTWQDKMGESEKAGNKGFPGTPRDGAAIEITGLLYSALTWVGTLYERRLYPHGGVDIGDGKSVTFGDWAAKIKSNFERCYYIPVSPNEDSRYDVDTKVVNRRGIYKDLYKSGKPYEDYQLRSNFPIAMTALTALALADKVLLGPVGMATLDPSDLNYRPNYNNSEDSTDFTTSKGRNYHQGPEWVWQRGYFLRAFLHFDLARRTTPEGQTEAYQQVTQSPWKGLTELTNKAGAHCFDSSPTQAWSAGCLLDLYYDASRYASKAAVRINISHSSCLTAQRDLTLQHMSVTESAAAAIITAAIKNDKLGGGHEPTWGDQAKGQRDLYTQLIISLTLGLSAFLSFCVLRPKWTELYAARRRQRCAASHLPELPDSFFGWIPVLYRITEEEVLHSAGLDAFVLLSFFKFAIRFLSAVFMFAVVIILPIHYKYTGKRGIPGWDDNDDNALGGNKDKMPVTDPDYLWMYVVFTYIFSGLAVYMLLQETNKIIRIRQKYLGSQTSTTDRTIRLSGIPQDMASEEKIIEFVEGLQVGKVENVTLCRDWRELDRLVDERLQILRNLERAWTKHLGYKRQTGDDSTLPLAHHRPRGSSLFSEDDSERIQLLSESGRDHIADYAHRRPTIRLWYGPLKLRYKNVDAIDYYEEKLRRIDEEIRVARQKQYPPTELAFVTMESIFASQMVVQAILDPHPMQLLARLAPAPADVVWKNTYLPRSRRMMQSWSITGAIGFLTVFWSVLLVPLAYLLELETLHKVFPQLAEALARNPIAKSLVQTGLPTLVLSLMTVAVPYLYNWLSNLQGMTSRGDVELSVISKNFFFSFFNLFLVFTVFGTATTFYELFKHLRDAFQDATTIAFALANSLENFAPFYINLIILQGVGMFPFRLLEFGSVAMYPINFFKAKTPREYAELSTPPTFSYGYSIPQTILILIICVVYSVFPSSWLICLFGLVYFAIGNFIYKYQLLYAMDHQQHSTGRAWPMICSRVLVGLMVFQVAMIGVFALRKAITRSLILVPLLGATVWFSYFFSRSYEPLMKFIALKSIDREGGGNSSPSPSTFSSPSGLDRDALPIQIGRHGVEVRLNKYVNPSLIMPLDGAWLPGRSVGECPGSI